MQEAFVQVARSVGSKSLNTNRILAKVRQSHTPTLTSSHLIMISSKSSIDFKL
jgi:hypothetical protein